jgi:hypothetical protein
MGLVPRLHRYSETLRLQHALPASLHCFRSAVPLQRSFVRSHGRWSTTGLGQGFGPGSPRRRSFLQGDMLASQVPGEPLSCVPCSSTPAGVTTLAIPRVAPCCLPTQSRRRPPQSNSFRGSISQPACLAVYASQPGSPPHHARLATGLLARLWPRGTLTRWVPSPNFRVAFPPPFPVDQALPGARLSESSFSCPSSKRPGRGCPVSDLRSLSGSLFIFPTSTSRFLSVALSHQNDILLLKV